MTAEGRFLIRTWRDAHRRRWLRSQGVMIVLAEHLPPIDERGADVWATNEAKRERRRRAHLMEAIAA